MHRNILNGLLLLVLFNTKSFCDFLIQILAEDENVLWAVKLLIPHP